MRVVAGTARGRKLVAPPGAGTRPTSDRVREAVFNALYSLGDPVQSARVLDLFAGTGALGIEALSRGAASATFVERDRVALAALEQNLGAAGVREHAHVVRREALDWLLRVPERYDIAFCDPPYDFAAWSELLAALPADLAVLESDRSIEPGPGWDVIRSRRYGGTVVSIVRRRDRHERAGAQP